MAVAFVIPRFQCEEGEYEVGFEATIDDSDGDFGLLCHCGSLSGVSGVSGMSGKYRGGVDRTSQPRRWEVRFTSCQTIRP